LEPDHEKFFNILREGNRQVSDQAQSSSASLGAERTIR